SVLAALYCGAAVVFIDEWTDLKRLNHCCSVAECKAVIIPPTFLFLKYLLAPLRKIPTHFSTKVKNTESNFSIQAIDPENSSAIITFSSGTTGTPKAADRTHTILSAQFEALQPIRNALPLEQNLTTLPIVLLLNLASGCTS